MDSILQHDIVLFGVAPNKICSAPLTGPVVVETGKPYKTTDSTGNVICCVSSRITKLDLSGTDPTCGPVKIRLCPDRPSRGKICQMMPGPCFPALSCFDVFIEIEVMGMILKNCTPARMCCKIDSLPPYFCKYTLLLNAGETLSLFKKGDCGNPNAVPVGEIRTATHTPQPPPCDIKLQCVQTAAGVSITFTVTKDPTNPADCCGKVLLTKDGVAVQTIGVPNVPSFTTTVTVPCEPAGVHVFCVQCLKADGTVGAQACCDVECPCTVSDPISAVTCSLDPASNQVVVTWTTVPGADASCCQEFLITKDGQPVQNVPGTVTSIVLPCEPPGTHEFCVQCIKADGTVGPRHCCTVTCGGCTDCIDTVTCRVIDDGTGLAGALIRWTTKPGCVCDKVEIFTGGALIATVPGTQNSFTITPCKDGDYCVRCVCANTIGAFHCCTVVCKTAVGCQLPCDCNQDGSLDISDGICLLGFLFLGKPKLLPCATDAANGILMNCNGDHDVGLSDAVYMFNFLFSTGKPPVLGGRCIEIPDCPDNPKCEHPCGQPPTDTPPAGADNFNSALQLNPVDDNGIPAGQPLKFIGPTMVMKHPAFLNGDGHWEIDTEMLQLDLFGLGPAVGDTVKLSPAPPATGKIISRQGPGGPFFPCDSFFDIFVDLSVPGMFTSNGIPITVKASNQTSVPGCDCYHTATNFHAQNPGAGPNFSGGHLPCPAECPQQNCREDLVPPCP